MNIKQLEQQFCLAYKIDERKLKDSEYLLLIELLLDNFKKITFEDVTDKFLGCVYLSQIESNEDNDEAFVGAGDDIKSVIMRQCLKEEAQCNEEFYENVRSKFVKFGQRAREAFNLIFG